MPRVSSLYDQGSARYVEDGHVVNPPFAVVVDGVSAPYSSNHPPILFDGISGGAMAVQVVEQAFFAARSSQALIDVLLQVNMEVARFQTEAGLDLFCADQLAGMTIAAAKWEDEKVEIIQAGDCLAFWEFKDGTFGVTPNQVRAHDTVMHRAIARLLREVANERGVDLQVADVETREIVRIEMWNRLYSILCVARRLDCNSYTSPRSFGLLNGQDALPSMWCRLVLSRKKIATLILVSDGMVPWAIMKGSSEQMVARTVLDTYYGGGLPSMLAAARQVGSTMMATNYLDFSEATGIAIEFVE